MLEIIITMRYKIKTMFFFSYETLKSLIVFLLGLAPSFTNLDDTSVIQNTLAGGSVVFTLTTGDPDQEDTNELAVTPTTFTGSALTFFELDTATRKYYL